MTFTEAKINLQKKIFFWKTGLAIIVIWLVALIVYLPPLIKGGLSSISFQDIAELEFIDIHYLISRWLDPLFILVWLLFITVFSWFLQARRLLLADQKLHSKSMNKTKDSASQEKEAEEESFMLDSYLFCFVFGGTAVGLWAAISFGAAFYGLISHLLFTVYLHVFMFAMAIIWSFLSPIRRFLSEKFRF
ncbi:MAG: hypothetical protein WC441_00175 [Patescibacteria group bacterium]